MCDRSFCLSLCHSALKKEWADFFEIWSCVWAYQLDEMIKFQWGSGPGYGFQITFRFPHHCGIRDFRIFTTFLIQSLPDFYETPRDDWRQRGTESTTFWERSKQTSVLIRQSGFDSQITYGWDCGVGGGLHSLSSVLYILASCSTDYYYYYSVTNYYQLFTSK